MRAEAQRLALAAVGCDGEGGYQRQLSPGDGQHGVLPALVDFPGALHRLDRVEPLLRGSGQRPIGVLELHVPASLFARRRLGYVRIGFLSLSVFDMFLCLCCGHVCVCAGRVARGAAAFRSTGTVIVANNDAKYQLGVVVGHDHRAGHELHVLQPGVVGLVDDPLPGGPTE